MPKKNSAKRSISTLQQTNLEKSFRSLPKNDFLAAINGDLASKPPHKPLSEGEDSSPSAEAALSVPENSAKPAQWTAWEGDTLGPGRSPHGFTRDRKRRLSQPGLTEPYPAFAPLQDYQAGPLNQKRRQRDDHQANKIQRRPAQADTEIAASPNVGNITVPARWSSAPNVTTPNRSDEPSHTMKHAVPAVARSQTKSPLVLHKAASDRLDQATTPTTLIRMRESERFSGRPVYRAKPPQQFFGSGTLANPPTEHQAGQQPDADLGCGPERTRPERSIDDIRQKGGTFTQFEKDKIFAFRDQFCADNGISKVEFADLVQGQVTESKISCQLFKELYVVLPHRSVTAVRKFSKRNFFNVDKRGAWNEEEDDELLQAITQLGRHWVKIGKKVGRLPEDCRDRWRNYFQVEIDRRNHSWGYDEEEALGHAVGDILYLIQEDKRKQAREKGQNPNFRLSERDCHSLLLWAAVSQRVRTRSRIQCLQKFAAWKSLEKTSYLGELRDAESRAADDIPERDLKGRDTGELSESQTKLLRGDVMTLTKAIRKSQAADDDSIDWAEIRSHEKWLRPFSENSIRGVWTNLKAEYLTDGELQSTDFVTYKMAKKVKKRMKRKFTKDERSDHWLLRREAGQGEPDIYSYPSSGQWLSPPKSKERIDPEDLGEDGYGGRDEHDANHDEEADAEDDEDEMRDSEDEEDKEHAEEEENDEDGVDDEEDTDN